MPKSFPIPKIEFRVDDRAGVLSEVTRNSLQIQTVVTGNPRCILQIRNGIREAGLDVRVAHPVELLADAYGG